MNLKQYIRACIAVFSKGFMSRSKQIGLSILTIPLFVVGWLLLGTSNLNALESIENCHFSQEILTSDADFLISGSDSSSDFPSDIPIGKENEGQEESESEVEESEALDYFFAGENFQFKLLLRSFETEGYSFYLEILNITNTPFYILFHSWKSDLI